MSLSSFIDNIDAVPLSAGFGVSIMGWSLTLAHLQTVVGVAAGIAGIVLTVATFRWRQRENRWRRREHEIQMKLSRGRERYQERGRERDSGVDRD